MMNVLRNFWMDEEGATAIEYGLLAGLIAVAIIATVGAIGQSLNGVFTDISGELDKVAPPAP